MKSKIYLNEGSLSRVLMHVRKTKRFGVLSPFRKDNSNEVNNEKYKELVSIIRSMGYSFIALRGGYIDDGYLPEKALFIPNIEKFDIIELGKKYNQHSILFKDEETFTMIGTNKDDGVCKILDIFKINRKNINIDDIGNKFKDFFSQLVKGSHRNKKFLFKMEEKIETSMCYNQKYGDEWNTILLIKGDI